MTTLKRFQWLFARGLRAGTPDDRTLRGLAPGRHAHAFEERFEVYRNNTWQFFQAALERSYPVLQRRVGRDYFRQLAREYRAGHPSRHGDLHWVSAAFPGWLAQRLGGSDYEWLGDLARLEWACEEALVARSAPPIELGVLGQWAPEDLPALHLQWHDSVRHQSSPFPVFSVWQANQPDAEPASIDLAQGAEHCVVACVTGGVVVYRLESADFALLLALMHGQTLGAAVDSTGADAARLARVLAWAFGEGLVIGVGAQPFN